ncbi:DUF2971 domain-containing protein [Brevundimonas nasdae]|uniref:DUF2971 domain-containing protein n=1 Tax=Brevundimonas nasdae TaxID=172043 RepID=UPI00301AE908
MDVNDVNEVLFGLGQKDLLPEGPLFKFLSTAPGQTPDWKERVTQLLDGKAYLPSPNQFNDPFDCLPRMGIPSSVEEFAKGREVFIDRIQKAVPDHPRAEIEEMIDYLVANGQLDSLAHVSRNAFNKGGALMGVFCLCECAENVLMWSHYANNHQGLALRFRFNRFEDNALLPLWKVKYQEQRPVLMKFFSGGNYQFAFIEALCTKADFWKYEQEWRYINPGAAGTVVEFNPNVIDAVILGAKISQEDAVWMTDLAKSRNLAIMHVRPEQETFALSFDGLWKPPL